MTEPTTITYVVTHFPRVTQTFIAAEIGGLRAAGHTVHTIALNPPSGVDAVHPDARTTQYLKSRSKLGAAAAVARTALRHPGPTAKVFAMALRAGGTDIARLSKRIFHFAESVLIWREATDNGSTLIHAHFGLTPSTLAMWAVELGRLTGVGPHRWSFTYHSASEMYNSDWALNAEKAESADVVVCVSDATRSQLMRTSDPSTWHKFVTIRCGIDLDEFTFRDPPAPHDPPVVSMVGRLAPEKGHIVLLDAMARLAAQGRPVRARIVGGGAFRADIEAAIGERGLGELVELVGELPPSDVRPEVEASDVFCLPSFDEGLPVAIMEAMAIGVPVVTTYIAGIPELAVNESTAMVVPSGNVEQLADAIAAITSDTELRKHVTHNARRAVEAAHDQRQTVPALERALLEHH